MLAGFFWLGSLMPLGADSFYPNAGVDTTDEAETIPDHHGQWLLNSEVDRQPDQPFYQLTTLDFKYGFSPRWDIGIQQPYTAYWGSGNASGFNDFMGGLKYLWTPKLEEGRIIFSTVASIKLNTANLQEGLGNGVTDIAVHAIATHRWEKWAEHLNYGYNFLGKAPGVSRSNHPYYKFKVDRELSPCLDGSAEIYGEDNADLNFNQNTLQATVKFTCSLSDTFSLDYGMAWGLNNSSPIRRNLFGLTWNF